MIGVFFPLWKTEDTTFPLLYRSLQLKKTVSIPEIKLEER